MPGGISRADGGSLLMERGDLSRRTVGIAQRVGFSRPCEDASAPCGLKSALRLPGARRFIPQDRRIAHRARSVPTRCEKVQG